MIGTTTVPSGLATGCPAMPSAVFAVGTGDPHEVPPSDEPLFTTVVPGRNPWVHVAPPSVEVAKPMFTAPPLKYRPTWNAVTIVFPNESESGSMSVLCCAPRSLYGSDPILISLAPAAA